MTPAPTCPHCGNVFDTIDSSGQDDLEYVREYEHCPECDRGLSKEQLDKILGPETTGSTPMRSEEA